MLEPDGLTILTVQSKRTDSKHVTLRTLREGLEALQAPNPKKHSLQKQQGDLRLAKEALGNPSTHTI